MAIQLPPVIPPHQKEKILVTAALPYANGRAHLGHIAGAYLPADIYVRWLRLLGKDVIFVCGSDENGAPITIQAGNEGVSPQTIVDRFHTLLAAAMAGLNISFDIYSRTHIPQHDKVSQDIFLRLQEKGFITEHETNQPYCKRCEMFLPDRYIEGTCPHCHKPGARGDQCENCGRPVDATQLIDPECVVCHKRGLPKADNLEIRSTQHWYLRLDTLSDDISQYVNHHPEWRETVLSFSHGLLSQGLKERCITRDLSWGIPVPLSEGKGKVLYVWFDAPIGYITFTQQLMEELGRPEAWKDYWYNPDSGLVHFIGKDNTVFHAVIFPAMLHAHGDYRLADAVVANEFLNLNNEKISTSRDYAVWVDEYLVNFPADPLRYYLTAIAPETADSNFTWEDFQSHNNAELADTLGNFIQRCLAFCVKYYDAKVPSGGDISEYQRLEDESQAAHQDITKLLGEFKFRAAIERLMALARTGNQFLAQEAPWTKRKTEPEKAEAALRAALYLIEDLSVLIAPFMPTSSSRLRTFLQLPNLVAEPHTKREVTNQWQRPRLLTPGHNLSTPEVLFPKFDDSIIQTQVDKLVKN